jgi:hypothetical protein
MAAYENVRNVSVQVAVASSVAAALPYRFATWKNAGADREVITHVPGANGAVARGILSMKADAAGVVDGFATSSMALPDGGICLVELAEAVTDITVPLRIGGNSSEVDGAAYLANATGDFIVGYPLQTGGVGAIIEFQFFNGGLAA